MKTLLISSPVWSKEATVGINYLNPPFTAQYLEIAKLTKTKTKSGHEVLLEFYLNVTRNKISAKPEILERSSRSENISNLSEYNEKRKIP